MKDHPNSMTVAGVDGCRAGWICVFFIDDPSNASVTIFPDFENLVSAFSDNTIIAVDMPIGLPEKIGRAGRGPEKLVRPHLGERQSSVFSIPARAAVYCDDYTKACRIAQATSEPPRKVSKQAFHLFPKIRQIDHFLRKEVPSRDRIIESHPEFAFWALNGNQPMHMPKKVKSRINSAGIEERKSLLFQCGFTKTVLEAPLAGGAGDDDLLDACAVSLIAKRRAEGIARPWPDPPGEDAHGLPVAIWA
jgi:predicted RNase H-like nuclease